MEKSQQASQGASAHEAQERHKHEEYKVSGQGQQQELRADAPLSSPQYQAQGTGTDSYQNPQIRPQATAPGPGEQFFGMPAGGQHAPGEESCGCQGNMEAYAYGEPSPNMQSVSFFGPQGMPQQGSAGQPQMPMNHAACSGGFGQQPMQNGPMVAPGMPMMPGMPFQGHPAPQYGPQASGQYGPQNPGPYGPQVQAHPEMPMAEHVCNGTAHAAPQFGPQNPGPYGPQVQAHPTMPVTGHSCSGAGHTGHGVHGYPGQPAHDQNQYQYQYGQLMDIVGDMMAGDPDVSKIMRFFQSCDTQFLKGVLIGAVGMFLLTNDTVKSTIVDMISGVWGTFQKIPSEKSPEDDESDVQTEAKTAPKTSSRTTSKTASKTTEK